MTEDDVTKLEKAMIEQNIARGWAANKLALEGKPVPRRPEPSTCPHAFDSAGQAARAAVSGLSYGPTS